MMITPLVRRGAALAGAAALLLTAACDGSSASGGDGGEATVRLGFSAWPGWFPWQVADEQDLFAANDVDVELIYFESYTDSLNALATGNLEANSQTLNDTLAWVSGGSAQTIVLTNDNSTGNDQIIAKEEIATVADLAGAQIGVEEGTVDHFLLLLALEEAGLTEADVEIVPMLTDQAAAAFFNGQIDAVGAFAPFTTTALERPGSAVVTSSADFPGAIPDHLVFDSGFVEENPDLVQAVVDTWFDTLDWIADNPDEATGIMAERAGVSVEDYQTYDAGTTIFSQAENLAAFAPGDTPANLDHMAEQIADFLSDTGLVDERPSVDGLLDPQFVTAASG
jgi:NitT/TauT family transport system substrate-binding protein